MLLKDLQTLATKLATGTLFHVEKAGKAYSVDYSALAKAIIEEYADSTVGGSKQSVQAAIGALNSSMVAIPSSNNNRLPYVPETDCNLLTQEWALGGGNNFPSGERFWYIHSIAYLTNSDGTIQIGKQIAYAYSSDISYVRVYKNNIWSDWAKTPTRAEMDALDARVTALENN